MRDKTNRLLIITSVILVWLMTYLNTVDIENMQAKVNKLQHQVSAQQEQIKVLDAENVIMWRERMEVE